jgi:type II secretory pathway pseudopilin PulG
MREILFVLIVVLVLLALTAIRYRKQIAGMIGIARMLRQAKRSAAERVQTFPKETQATNPLVNCSKCDIWVPQGKAVRFRDGFICSKVCEKEATRSEPPVVAGG